jgi:hypothetical protein
MLPGKYSRIIVHRGNQEIPGKKTIPKTAVVGVRSERRMPLTAESRMIENVRG